MKSRSAFVALCLLFVCSGACGLTYQVLWLRLLALVFGVTVHAASTVLASFMAGLALGSLLAERAGAARPSVAGVRGARSRDRRVGAGHPGAARRRRGPLPPALRRWPATRSRC